MTNVGNKIAWNIACMRINYRYWKSYAKTLRTEVLVDDDIFFSQRLTDDMCQALFPAEAIVGCSHHHKPTSREQDTNLR